MIYIGLMFLGAGMYFAYRFGVSWLYDALVREHLYREVKKEIGENPMTRHHVMFFEYDEVWPEEQKKEAV